MLEVTSRAERILSRISRPFLYILIHLARKKKDIVRDSGKLVYQHTLRVQYYAASLLFCQAVIKRGRYKAMIK